MPLLLHRSDTLKVYFYLSFHLLYSSTSFSAQDGRYLNSATSGSSEDAHAVSRGRHEGHPQEHGRDAIDSGAE